MNKILFVCRYNRFRSRIAAAYFKRLHSNFEIKSAGLVRGNPVDKNQIKVAREFRLNISGRPKAMSSKILEWADKIIVVAVKVFDDGKGNYEKVKILRVKDTGKNSISTMRRVAKDVIKAIEGLNL